MVKHDHYSRRYRFGLVAGATGAVLVLHALGKPPNGELLTWLGVVINGYLAGSHWGQAKRAAAPTESEVTDK